MCTDATGVAESMLDGEIAYRKGEFDEAFAKLREAVRERQLVLLTHS